MERNNNSKSDGGKRNFRGHKNFKKNKSNFTSQNKKSSFKNSTITYLEAPASIFNPQKITNEFLWYLQAQSKASQIEATDVLTNKFTTRPFVSKLVKPYEPTEEEY